MANTNDLAKTTYCTQWCPDDSGREKTGKRREREKVPSSRAGLIAAIVVGGCGSHLIRNTSLAYSTSKSVKRVEVHGNTCVLYSPESAC